MNKEQEELLKQLENNILFLIKEQNYMPNIFSHDQLIDSIKLEFKTTKELCEKNQ